MWSAVDAPTIIALAQQSRARAPEAPILIFEDGLVLSRRELFEAVERFTPILAATTRAGDRVLVSMANRAEFFVAFFAIVLARGIVVPLNPESGTTDAAHVIETCAPTVAIADEAGRKRLADVATSGNELVVYEVDGIEPNGLTAGDARFKLDEARCQRDDIIAITFTSGTTGLPKGCMIDHTWALRTTDLALRVHEYTPTDRIFYPVRFHYMDALLALLRALQCGGAYVVARKFSVSRFWSVVRAHDVTVVSTIASMPAFLLKAEPTTDDHRHKVRLGIQAHIVPELHAAMDERWGFPWVENYGMMEAGLIARVPLELAGELRGTGSVGPPLPEVEVRLVDEDGGEVPVGEIGEILVRQEGQFRGYYGLPDATAEIMQDGWVATGDLGTFDTRGYLSVVGRKKDVIRRSGENISPPEVEAVLTSHPRILEAAVVGVPDPDRGEEVKAYVRLIEGTSEAELSREDILEYCQTRLARHKVPRYVEYVLEFSHTPSMRIRKETLRRTSGLSGDSASG